MAGLVGGDVRKLKDLHKLLFEMTETAAIRVAAASVGGINAQSERSYAAGETPEGQPWKPSEVTGERVTLVKSGNLKRQVRYVAIGTAVRCALGVKYAKYQIGKRRVFPHKNSLLPVAYREAIVKAVNPILQELAHRVWKEST